MSFRNYYKSCNDNFPIKTNQSPTSESVTAKKLQKGLARGKVKAFKKLNKFLTECSDILFVESCVRWMQFCCVIDEGNSESTQLKLNTLSRLTEISLQFPELAKPIANSVISRFMQVFLSKLMGVELGWKTLEILLWSYNGPFASHKAILESEMKAKLLDAEKLLKAESLCFALLPSAGGGSVQGSVHKANWFAQFSQLLTRTNLLVNSIFQNNDQVDPNDRNVEMAQIVNRYVNHHHVLQSMLLGRYPTTKTFKPNAVLDLVESALTEMKLSTNTGWHNALPGVLTAPMATLSALVVFCSNTLLPCTAITLRILRTALQIADLAMEHRPQLLLSVYSALSCWLTKLPAAVCSEGFQKALVPILLENIESRTPIVIMKDTTKTTTEPGRNKLKMFLDDFILTKAALETLHLLVSATGFRIAAELHKLIQTAIIQQLMGLEKRCGSDDLIYSRSPSCRQLLYTLIVDLCLEPNPKWPPPTQFALRFLQVGSRDTSPIVAQSSLVGLSILNRLIHPEFSVARFPIDFEAVLERNELKSNLPWKRRRIEEIDVDDSANEENHSIPRSEELTPESDVPETLVSSNYFVAPAIEVDVQSLNRRVERVAPKLTVEKQFSDSQSDSQTMHIDEAYEEGEIMIDNEKPQKESLPFSDKFIPGTSEEVAEHDEIPSSKKPKLDILCNISETDGTVPNASTDASAFKTANTASLQESDLDIAGKNESDLPETNESNSECSDPVVINTKPQQEEREVCSPGKNIRIDRISTPSPVGSTSKRLSRSNLVTRYHLRSQDSPMELRSGNIVGSSPARVRSRSISSNSSRVPGSPRSEIADGDIDLINSFDDTLRDD